MHITCSERGVIFRQYVSHSEFPLSIQQMFPAIRKREVFFEAAVTANVANNSETTGQRPPVVHLGL